MSDTNELNSENDPEKIMEDFWVKYCPSCGKEFTDPTPFELSFWQDYQSKVSNTRIRCLSCYTEVNVEFKAYMQNGEEESRDGGGGRPPMSY